MVSFVACIARANNLPSRQEDPNLDYLPHPARVGFLAAAECERSDQLDARIETRLQQSQGTSGREQSVVRSWMAAGERAGVTEYEMSQLGERVISFQNLADDVLNADESSIFDVSSLVSKLPLNDISQFNLADLVLPGDETIYIHFGRQEAFVLDGTDDLYLEGAYVTQIDHGDGGDEKSSFRAILVYSDPNFDAEAFERPLGRTLKRNTDYVRFDILHTDDVGKGFSSLAQNGDRQESQVMAAGFQTYRYAYDRLVRCMIYLGTPDRDLEAGFFAGAPVSMQRKALKGDPDALYDLLSEGFPAVQFVGRNIKQIAKLEQPDWGSQTFGFGR
ncbi:hypothetical protein JXZ79_21395 [Rhizobium cremeum]|nr:hypothetical protein [Rhizobium cremeum]